MSHDGLCCLETTLLIHAALMSRLEVAHQEVALGVHLHEVQLQIVQLLLGKI